MTRFAVTITSDTVCPWCYVGARKLDAGIAAYRAMHPDSGDSFSVRWSPFLLNPEAPRQGIDKLKYYENRFGNERTAAMFTRITTEGEKVGINFNFGGKTGSTRDSHRIIAMAGQEELKLKQQKQNGAAGASSSSTSGNDDDDHHLGLQDQLVRELFRLYFEEEGDITSAETIVTAAARAGMDKEKVQRWLQKGDGSDEVDRMVAAARRALITGVPNFVINDKYEIQGAQDPDGFRRVFEKIKEVDG